MVFFLFDTGIVAPIAAVAAVTVRRADTDTVDPRGTYVSNVPSKMLISSSKDARTSGGASCTAAMISAACSGVRSSTMMASKISVASSAVTVARTSGSVA